MNMHTIHKLDKVPGVAIGTSSNSETFFKDSTGATAKLLIPGKFAKIVDGGRLFKVRAFGTCKGQTSATTLTLKLYWGLDISNPGTSNVLIETGTARAITGGRHLFEINAELRWDSLSEKIQGVGSVLIANLYDAMAAIDNIPTGVKFATEPLGFTVSGTMSTSHADNMAQLRGFELDLL